MKSRTIAFLVTVGVVALVGASLLVASIVAKATYDEAKEKYENELPSRFAVQQINSATREKLREIAAGWSCRKTDVGGAYSQAMELAGMAPTAADVVQLFNYRMPAYAWFDPDANTKSKSLAIIQATIVPISIDQTIYLSADKSMILILHSESEASIIRETESGLQEELWTKNSNTTDGARDRPSAAESNG